MFTWGHKDWWTPDTPQSPRVQERASVRAPEWLEHILHIRTARSSYSNDATDTRARKHSLPSARRRKACTNDGSKLSFSAMSSGKYLSWSITIPLPNTASAGETTEVLTDGMSLWMLLLNRLRKFWDALVVFAYNVLDINAVRPYPQARYKRKSFI